MTNSNPSPNKSPKNVKGETLALAPNHLKQHEGEKTLSFRISLKDEYSFYRVFIEEIETGIKTDIQTQIKSRTIAENSYSKAIDNIIKTGQYKLTDSVKNDVHESIVKSMMFTRKGLFLWAFPTSS